MARAGGPVGDVLSTIMDSGPGQAGHLLLLHLATMVGHDEFTLRAPSVMAISLAAGLLVVLGTLLFGRVGGVVAGIALAANAGVVEASREVRPYALGILGIVVATLLFVVALERGGSWRWVPYAFAAAALPLLHPLAASVLAAHGATLIARRDRADRRSAGIALVAGTAVAGCLLAWMAAGRFDARAGAEVPDLARLGPALADASGWNAVLALAAVTGLVVCFRVGHSWSPGRWVGVLVAALIASPVVVTLLTAVALPVHLGALVLSSPGVALAGGAAGSLLSGRRRLLWAGLAVLLLASAVTITVALRSPVDEDWRSLAAVVRHGRGPSETVIVLPEGSRAAFAYYAPYLATTRFARGEGAWVAVTVDTAQDAIDISRPVVPTPRYALLRQVRYGNGLRLQHWVRP